MLISKIFWWIRQICLILAGCFFLYFGIMVLIGAYRLNDPFTFIMTFFSASLIILISGALLTGFIVKLISSFRKEEKNDIEEITDS